MQHVIPYHLNVYYEPHLKFVNIYVSFEVGFHFAQSMVLQHSNETIV